MSLDFRRLKDSGMKAKGIIIKFDIIKGKEGDTYFPVVQFRNYSGIEIIGKPMRGFKEKEYQNAPNEVEVIYLKSNAKKFIIEGQKFDNMLWLVLVGMTLGYAFMVVSSAKFCPHWVNDFNQFFDKF